MPSWSSGQDVALSRLNQGFDSPWGYHFYPCTNASFLVVVYGYFYFYPNFAERFSKILDYTRIAYGLHGKFYAVYVKPDPGSLVFMGNVVSFFLNCQEHRCQYVHKSVQIEYHFYLVVVYVDYTYQ